LLFYALGALALAGGLATALLTGERRLAGMAALGLGLAGLYLDLSAGFAAVVALVCYAVIAALLLRIARTSPSVEGTRGPAAQAAGPLAGIVFLVLAYSAYKGSFVSGYQALGQVNAAGLGRLLFGRDALAVEAVVASLVVAAVAIGLAARTVRRIR
jgi:NADH:ubiquinone oxidoreductase subunit 6 (subunit J)